MEKKNPPPLPPKVFGNNEKSKNLPNLMTELEENIQPKPLQPAVKKRYSFTLIFEKIIFTVKSRVLTCLI